MTFDPGVLEALDVTPGSLLTLDGVSVQAERNREAGRVRARFSRESAASGSGAVAVVQFKGVSAGASPLAFATLTLTTSAGDDHPIPPVCSAEVVP